MRNLTNTMIAWTPAKSINYETAGQISLIDHPWLYWTYGPFPYSCDFGASSRSVKEADFASRKKMLTDLIERIIADGFDRSDVMAAVSELEEAQ
jgi:hypothetical protein